MIVGDRLLVIGGVVISIGGVVVGITVDPYFGLTVFALGIIFLVNSK